MGIKVLEFMLSKFPEIQEFVANKIQELEDTMVGAKGKEKKEELDRQAVLYASGLIIAWDIPQVPNIIENNILDPAVIKAIELYLPAVTQKIYDIAVIGIKKLDDLV